MSRRRAAHRRRQRQAGLTAASATALVAGLSFGSPVAHASGCTATATEVADGVFEIRFTDTTACDWEIPDGVTQLEALLVGSGGGSVWAYAGGGGEVKLMDLTGATGTLNVRAGESASYGSGESWGDTPDRSNADSVVSDGTDTHIAVGGYAGATAPGTESAGACGGPSGNGNLGHCDYVENDGGGGAGGAANGDGDGGDGVTVSTIAESGSLFADVTDCYGGGGASGELIFSAYPMVSSADFKSPGCGGGVASTTATAPFDIDVTTISHEIGANTGGGAGSNGSISAAPNDGSDGIVVIRYATATSGGETEEQLTSAGIDAVLQALIGGGIVAAGAATVVGGNRRRRPAN